jgi:hypothetical protein
VSYETSVECMLKLEVNFAADHLMANVFNTEAFLANLNWQNLDACEVAVLSKLCRKVEISHHLFSRYSSDLNKPETDELLAIQYVEFFCGLCFWIAETRADMQFLNCGLKMLDGVLIEQSVPENDCLLDWANQLLETIN